jgi:hypothetical protein
MLGEEPDRLLSEVLSDVDVGGAAHRLGFSVGGLEEQFWSTDHSVLLHFLGAFGVSGCGSFAHVDSTVAYFLPSARHHGHGSAIGENK